MIVQGWSSIGVTDHLGTYLIQDAVVQCYADVAEAVRSRAEGMVIVLAMPVPGSSYPDLDPVWCDLHLRSLNGAWWFGTPSASVLAAAFGELELYSDGTNVDIITVHSYAADQPITAVVPMPVSTVVSRGTVSTAWVLV